MKWHHINPSFWQYSVYFGNKYFVRSKLDLGLCFIHWGLFIFNTRVVYLHTFPWCISAGSSSPTVQEETRTSGTEPEASTQDKLPPLCLRLLPPTRLRRADYLRQKHEEEHSLFTLLPWKNSTKPQLQLDRKHVKEEKWSFLCLTWKWRWSTRKQQQCNTDLKQKKARRLNSTFKTLHRVKGTVCMDPADQAQFWVNLCSNQLHKCTSVIFVF